MPDYGFKVYNKSSEVHFSKYNNGVILTPDTDRALPNFNDIDFNFNPNTLPDHATVKFTLKRDTILYFKNNGLNFNFIPIVLGKSLASVLNHKAILDQLKNWNGNDITIYLRLIPMNLTAYYQVIRRNGNNRKVKALIIVGFQ